MNTEYYHPQSQVFVTGRQALDPQFIHHMRQALPESHRYNAKFVVISMAEGLSGQVDREWFADWLEILGNVRASGCSPKDIEKALAQITDGKERKKAPCIPVSNDPNQRLAAYAANENADTEEEPIEEAFDEEEEIKNKESLRKSKKPKGKSSEKKSKGSSASAGHIRKGSTIFNLDPRRKAKGTVLEVTDKTILVEWQKTGKRELNIDRVLNPRLYKIV